MRPDQLSCTLPRRSRRSLRRHLSPLAQNDGEDVSFPFQRLSSKTPEWSSRFALVSPYALFSTAPRRSQRSQHRLPPFLSQNDEEVPSFTTHLFSKGTNLFSSRYLLFCPSQPSLPLSFRQFPIRLGGSPSARRRELSMQQFVLHSDARTAWGRWW